MMNWDEIRRLAADPLVTIGAHTRRHYALAKLTLAEARAEIEESVRRIEREIGKPCRHFSYPYGDEASAGQREFDLVKELGLKTGVTTRKGLIHPRHAAELTALPRVSLNGDYQKPRYVKVLLSGAPFALFNVMQKASERSLPGGVTGRHACIRTWGSRTSRASCASRWPGTCFSPIVSLQQREEARDLSRSWTPMNGAPFASSRISRSR